MGSDKLMLKFLISASGFVFRGWVLCSLWGWFIVGLGAPAIGVVHSMGILVVVSLLVYRADASLAVAIRDQTEQESLAVNIANSFALPAVALVVGALTKMML